MCSTNTSHSIEVPSRSRQPLDEHQAPSHGFLLRTSEDWGRCQSTRGALLRSSNSVWHFRPLNMIHLKHQTLLWSTLDFRRGLDPEPNLHLFWGLECDQGFELPPSENGVRGTT